jgi:hypothetical protein
VTLAPGKHVVVVDGSNLATEGRTTPSLRQLDEAVRSYAAENPDAEIVVVVDASFEHRIDPSERNQLIDAELHGEVVSPPAGAIGRGDAFVLRIAERTGAIVLSNDSFQEFHAEHPWLFDKGRLVGGKPVTGVGWIFTPRIPVRGPKSRQAQGKAKGGDVRALSPPVKAAELAKAAKKVAARKAPLLPDGSIPKVGDVWPEGPSPAAGTPEATAKREKKVEQKGPSLKGARAKGEKQAAATERAAAGKHAAEKHAAKKAPAKKAPAEKAPAKKAVEPAAKKRAAERADAEKVAAEKHAAEKHAAKKAPAKKAPAKKAPAKKAVEPAAKKRAAEKHAAKKAPAKKAPAKKAVEPAAKKKAAEKAAAPKNAAAKKEAPIALTATNGESGAGAVRSTATTNPAVKEAIGQALAEVIAPVREPVEDDRPGHGDEERGKRKGKDGHHRRRRSQAPPPAVNEPLAFITFVATYPLESELEGQVVSFTSHGAMVDVDLPGGGVLHSYIPLTAMGDPPPSKARQVLQRGERRRFMLVALDPPRRVAELALPELVAGGTVAER